MSNFPPQWPSRQQFEELEQRVTTTENGLAAIPPATPPTPEARLLPEGGTAGQILSKTVSGSQWIKPPNSGGSSPLPSILPAGGNTLTTLNATNAYSAFETMRSIDVRRVTLNTYGLTDFYPAELLVFAEMGTNDAPSRLLVARVPMYYVSDTMFGSLVAEIPIGLRMHPNVAYFFGVTTPTAQPWRYMQPSTPGTIKPVLTSQTYSASTLHAAPDTATPISDGEAALPFEFTYYAF